MFYQKAWAKDLEMPMVTALHDGKPDPAVIAQAAALILNGKLVAFPTETVYGLGANALETEAVAKIFALKGRPATNPVIVHVTGIEQARSLALEWTENAQKLADAFWPGPLTLVVKKKPIVPDIVTAGGETVALRMPKHPVALALLKEAGVPIAAPSANRSTELSPTRAMHVAKSFPDLFILDGGPCEVGIESTVVDVTSHGIHILREGMIQEMQLRKYGTIDGNLRLHSRQRSPGMLAKHYSPKTPVEVYEVQHDLFDAAALYRHSNKRIAVLCVGDDVTGPEDYCLSNDFNEYARELYSVLHDLDEKNLDAILIELPAKSPEWSAIRDRLTRASA